ncbi:MAG: alginate export family protein, partial [Candidatus Theseobacter exili]|nr:alginate export family protein [Candidatus Theseobacter exili]
MNSTNIFFQAIIRPLKRLTIRTDYHVIWLTESRDRWYMGSGPTQEKGSIFGYLGRPSNGEDYLGQELDVMMKYVVNPHCNLVLSYSHVFGKDVIKRIYGEDSNADY